MTIRHSTSAEHAVRLATQAARDGYELVVAAGGDSTVNSVANGIWKSSVDEKQLIRGIQKVANRITIGLLLAALVIGASLMMYVDTSIKLWGYPAISITFFLLAAFGAFGLILQIIFKDRI